MIKSNLLFLFVIIILIGCSDTSNEDQKENCNNSAFFDEYSAKNFEMGFTTWIYAPTEQAKNNTYKFIKENSNIYSEHIDNDIPWSAWINDLVLPQEFTNEIDSRLANKLLDKNLLLSISLLNIDRSDLAPDFDGSIPSYTSLNDKKIEDAYFKHVDYLIQKFQPNYLAIAIEVNELRVKSKSKWEEYKLLIKAVKNRIKNKYPNLQISESITLHNLFKPDVLDPNTYINEIVNYANEMEFVLISYYPFFKAHHTKEEFQSAFDFLHEKINKPIAFSETSQIAEDLSVSSFNLFLEGNECEQNIYLETLLKNAQEHNYKFVIWWSHRDFDTLWETFPEELKDLGKLWRDTGLLNENGKERIAYETWQKVYKK